jgi:signal transduction histidine kinase
MVITPLQGMGVQYDIFKAHGGELKVATVENEGAVFTFVLPAGTI